MIDYDPVVRTATASPTCDTNIYASGDLIGGKLSLVVNKNNGVINTLVLTDAANQKSALDVVFFVDNPSNTVFTDQAALDIHDTDLKLIAGRITLAATDYVSYADNAEATVKPNFGYQLVSGTTLYACLVSRGTPTYAAATDLQLRVTVL